MTDNLYATTQPPLDTYSDGASRNNASGTDQDVIERAKIREICEGWGVYRFPHGVEMDNEADCRFFFLLEKREGKWGVVFYTLLFDKDKMVPVNPSHEIPSIPEEEVRRHPAGYRYLAWCEANISKTPPKMDLSSHGKERNVSYGKVKDWLDGKEVKPNLTGEDVVEKW
ncbi:hypothetical protein LTR78_010807 [Recurvomyces mirabilis]|uniref:Uncharacterized protein n=2 Tax=Recurvomyces mirabilis TaxID=574656 RepID=A0AAE0WI29_9PEZI|nr:hypothetical protein LTR78_010807 [Recurvomyces mirabilis]